MSTLTQEVACRRTFAIISHPDAGKTTLTEKLLLYGGAIRQAGSVKARRAERHATSDWMEIEKQRGISVTSSAMQFEFDGYHINILDTPGHRTFLKIPTACWWRRTAPLCSSTPPRAWRSKRLSCLRCAA